MVGSSRRQRLFSETLLGPLGPIRPWSGIFGRRCRRSAVDRIEVSESRIRARPASASEGLIPDAEASGRKAVQNSIFKEAPAKVRSFDPFRRLIRDRWAEARFQGVSPIFSKMFRDLPASAVRRWGPRYEEADCPRQARPSHFYKETAVTAPAQPVRRSGYSCASPPPRPRSCPSGISPDPRSKRCRSAIRPRPQPAGGECGAGSSSRGRRAPTVPARP